MTDKPITVCLNLKLPILPISQTFKPKICDMKNKEQANKYKVIVYANSSLFETHTPGRADDVPRI
jgi:hypothetical protein